MQDGLDYIEEHLHQDLDFQEISRVAHLSSWHFQRVFKAVTKETLKTYIRSRRLARAQKKILAGNERIVDIALDSGFTSPEAFTRAFKKLFGVTPTGFREQPERALFVNKLRLDDDYLRHIEKHLEPEPVIWQRPAMRLVGMKTNFYGPESDKNNMAHKLPGLWDSFLARLGEVEAAVGGVGYGLISQSKVDHLIYYALVEVKTDSSPPKGMESLFLPTQRMAKFCHRGPVKNLDHTVSYIYSNWLLQTHHRHSLGPDLEVYGAEYHPSSHESVIHYGVPLE